MLQGKKKMRDPRWVQALGALSWPRFVTIVILIVIGSKDSPLATYGGLSRALLLSAGLV